MARVHRRIGKTIGMGVILVLLASTAQAYADYYTWDEANQTATLWKNQEKWIAVKRIGIVEGVSEHREVLEVSSNHHYDFSILDDFRVNYEVHKGKAKVEDISSVWYLRTSEKYNMIVNDYGVSSRWESKIVYNNVTKQDETIWYWNNQTVVVGNHTEVWTMTNESVYTPLNKKIGVGQTLTFVKVTKKKAELGDFSILIKPMFMGASIRQLTWWNGSWSYRVDNILPNDQRPYQYGLNLSDASGINNVTHVYGNGHFNVNYTDVRFTFDNTTELPYWIDNATADPTTVWVNVTSNGTVNLYYGNPLAISTSNIGNTFIFGDDFSGDLSKWNYAGASISGGQVNISASETGANYIGSIVNVLNQSILEFTAKIYSATTQHNLGLSDDNTSTITWNDDNAVFFHYSQTGDTYATYQNPTYTFGSSSANNVNTHNYKIEWTNSGTTTRFFRDAVQITSPISSFPTSTSLFIVIGDHEAVNAAQIDADDIRVRKYASPEPAWATWGGQQTNVTPKTQIIVIS